MNLRDIRRPAGRFFFCLLSLILLAAPLVCALPADQPARTVISDVLYRADGSPASGKLLISWSAFTSADGKPVAAGSLSATIGAGGAVSLSLVPTQGAQPATYYKVVLKLDDGGSSTEYWTVPALSPTTIAAIRSQVVPQSVALQVVSREYVDGALNATVHKSGDETIAGIKEFAASPLVPTPSAAAQAANKDYVDAAVVTGGGGNILALDRGGTNNNQWTASRCVRVANDGSKLESAASDCGSGSGNPDLSAPGPIGGTTPNSGTFTTLTAKDVNGVPTSSQYSTVQAAVDGVSANGGIFGPCSSNTLSATLHIPALADANLSKSVSFNGASPWCFTLQPNANSMTVLRPNTNASIGGFNIAPNGKTGVAGIYGYSAPYVKLHDYRIGAVNKGIWLHGDQNLGAGAFVWSLFNGVEVGPAYGIYADTSNFAGVPWVQANDFFHHTITGATSEAIHLDGAGDLNFFGGDIESNQWGFRFTNGNQLRLFGTHSEKNFAFGESSSGQGGAGRYICLTCTAGSFITGTGWDIWSQFVNTTGSISSGTNTLAVASISGIIEGKILRVNGAGPAGGDLTCEVSAISGTTVTLVTPGTTSVCNAATTVSGSNCASAYQGCVTSPLAASNGSMFVLGESKGRLLGSWDVQRLVLGYGVESAYTFNEIYGGFQIGGSVGTLTPLFLTDAKAGVTNWRIRTTGGATSVLDIDFANQKVMAPVLQSTIATGTAPLIVASTTAVTNLNADRVDGKHASDFANTTHTHAESEVTNLTTDLAAKQATAEKNAANGYAGLNASSKLAASQLPAPTATTLGGVEAKTCSGTDKLSAIGTDGVPVCSADQNSGGGGSLTVREADGSPSVSTTTLEFDQAAGFVVTDQTGGVARASLTGVEKTANKNAASGYAGLGSDSRIAAGQSRSFGYSTVNQSCGSPAAATTCATLTIPAGTLAPGDRVQCDAFWTHTGTANGPRWWIAFGGAAMNPTGGIAGAADPTGYTQGTVTVMSSSAERAFGNTIRSNGSATGGAQLASLSIDTSQAINVTFVANFNTTTSDTINLDTANCTVLKQ